MSGLLTLQASGISRVSCNIHNNVNLQSGYDKYDKIILTRYNKEFKPLGCLFLEFST